MEIEEQYFLKHVTQVGSGLMWFLGAGTSRSARLPTATDIIWDLKCRLYCLRENQDIQTHDVNNKAVRGKIQSYMDSQGYPPLWDMREYSFYFEQTFGEDYAAQQRYLSEALSPETISLNIGHRALSALMHMRRADVVFTTNFDEVIEAAYSFVTSKHLSPFHLEGSYAALDALNNGQFPIYAKIHGDFKYQSVKNLSKDLLSNDVQLQKCLIAAATRFGLIVTGYSGRDSNVMAMLREAVNQNNAFPHGLFWTVPQFAHATPVVHEFLEYAREKGVKCGLVQTGTFDEMLSKIWRQTPDKPKELDAKVRSATARPVAIALPGTGKAYPMLRTNALLITKAPSTCGTVVYDGNITAFDLRTKIFENKAECVACYTDTILFWGAKSELPKITDEKRIREVKPYEIGEVTKITGSSSFIKALVEDAVAAALVQGKPVNLRRQGRTKYAVAKHDEANKDIYQPLRRALKGSPIHGDVPGLKDVHWAEAAAIRVEVRAGRLWLLLRPDVWIHPLRQREHATDFLRKRKLKRWNAQAYEILSAWIQILVGDVGMAQTVTVSAFPDTDFPAVFEISTRSAFSRRND